MLTDPKVPIILLTFANDADAPLRGLAEEHDALQEILKIPQREGKCKVVAITAATPEKLIKIFQEYQHQIRIFHYAGHSNQDAIFLKKDYPGQAATQATDLAGFLALQEGLELVFLNSCLSMGQAEVHQQAGIPAVLATNVKINDTAAVNFAKVFYQGIAGGATISKAFEQTEQGMQTKHGKELRGISLPPLPGQGLPWQLFPPGTHQWRLPLVAKRLTKLPTLDLEKEFFGREEDLQRLSKKLENSTKVVLMNGLGGIGKTVLATAYTQTQQQHYDHIAWINRGEDLINSFALNGDLAETLGMPIEKDDPPEERFPRILHKLRNLPGNNLLVIDNAQQQVAQKEIYNLLPGHPNWRVLLTSRLDLPQFDPIRLDTLGTEAAKQLFQEHYQGNYTEVELVELLQEIGYHTLTIELLARLLNRLNNLMSVSELTAIMREKQLDDPDLQELIYSRHSGTERGIYLHLMKAFELTNLTEKEIWLLKQFIVLPAEQYPVTKLADLLDKKPLSLNKTLNNLAEKGWITKHEDKSFSIHHLIRKVTEYQLNPRWKDLDRLTKVLINKLYHNEYGNPVTDNFPSVQYAVSVAKYLEAIGQPNFNLQENLAITLQDLGDYKSAMPLMRKAMLSAEMILGPKDNVTIRRYSNFATILHALGHFQEAKELLEKAVELSEEEHNVKPDEIAARYSNLALVLKDLGDYLRAKELLKKAVLITENSALSNTPSLALRYSNLATVLQELGEYEEAKIILEKSLDLDIKHLGPQHPNTSIRQANLGVVLLYLGNYERAKSLLQEALISARSNFPPEHPTIATYCSNLGTAIQQLGEYEIAKELLQEAVLIDETNFGNNHPNTAISYANLALVLVDLGDRHQAQLFLERAFHIFYEKLGLEHPQTKVIKFHLQNLKSHKQDMI